ncbi:hypothetical protein F511_13788 [Dorcoceras hygrometricum]|uniref:Uncharacterized protein n=1 Tax=Dorcoceras hygrometricum TaxID=472368 RepID=A0A2Z7BY37_9LAMI|nr:hypothetical protein F511_13788 [Dorcoceras hygrometricum]
MPKDRRVNSPTFDRSRVSPYTCNLKATGCHDEGSSSPLVGDEREWEESRCPICMDHPHNAVLLICSSQEKGCRPFMCDTSYRHSNCLDQYRKSSSSSTTGQKSDLVCPLCRGCITGWVVKEPARRFMNWKRRCCSLETCNFSGNYPELRKHARLEHPSDRPSEASTIRQSNWTTLERQLDINDALVHQLDFEDAWDGWPSWDELGDADFWSDGTFFDFPMEEMSDFDDDVFGSLPLSDVTIFTSLETGASDSDFSGEEYDSLHRRSSADNSSPSSNNQSPSSSSRPTSVYHREINPTISESSPTSRSQGRSPLLITRSTSSYPIENNPATSVSNPRSNNGGGNSFSISRSTADSVNNSTNSRSRSRYDRENYVTYSRSRSSLSYRVEENASENSRSRRHNRSSLLSGEGSPLARRAGSRDFRAFSRQWSP